MSNSSRDLGGRLLLRIAIATLAMGLTAAVVGCGTQKAGATRPLRVGVLTDLTNFLSEYGQQELAGLQALQSQWNAAGGPTVVQLDVHDHKASPAEALSGLRRLLDTPGKRPNVIFSAMSSVSVAVLPVLKDEGILAVCNATSSAIVDQGAGFAVRNFPSEAQETQALFEHVVKPRQLANIGLIYINDEYGQKMKEAWTTVATADGTVRLTGVEAFEYSTTDFRAVAERVLAAKPDGICCVGYGSQMSALLRTINEIGFAGPKMVPSLIINTESVFSGGAAALEGVYFNGFTYDTSNPQYAGFVAEFQKRYPGRQSDIGALAYAGMRIVLETASELPSGQASPAAILDKIRNKREFASILGTIRYENGSFVYPLALFQVQGGNLVSLNGGGN
jgi:ABC-type branched-subunit amino acid transport system substrate-binding protein